MATQVDADGAPATLRQALRAALAAGLAPLDAELLLAHLLQRPRTWLIAHADDALDPALMPRWRDSVSRRADGVPLAYLNGRREFHGLDLEVTPDVLDPRPDTETLVDWALAVALPEPDVGAAPDVVDLGTGSGAIALALKAARPAWAVCAADRSAAALAVARRNGQRLGLAVDWREGDWWQAVAGRRFHLAVGNPPYIAEGDPHLAALRHEPRVALCAGPDGLADLRRLVAAAAGHLHEGAWLLLEHGHDQAAAVRALLQAAGFEAVESRRDLAGHERCSGGRWRRRPASPGAGGD